MISVNLMGGLGNMLFQIATGYSYSKMVNSPFYLLEGVKNFRDEDADLFKNKESYLKHCVPWEKYKKSIFKKIPIHPFRKLKLLRHGCFKYVDLPLKKNVMLSGFFQSEKFFKHYSSEIKKLFDFDYEIKKKNLRKFMTSKKKKVAVHIRRYKLRHHILPPLPWEYYENAMNKFDSNEYDFILFTDDYVEVINNMDTSKFLYYDESSELDDLFLMSQCDAFIMSNSTFSWWGAWLGKKRKKIIIPPIWFGIAGPTDLKDLIPEKWGKPSEISFLNPYKI